MVCRFGSRLGCLLVVGALGSVVLSGCGGGETVQQAVGYDQSGPDEMAVIKRPPLILPPDYNLRPPRPGEQTATSSETSEAARQVLVGPSAAAEGEAATSSDARELLVNGPSGETTETSADRAASTSDGQNALVGRTNRVERNLDALTETRAENRVDGALLQELLAFDPDERADEGAESAGIVQVVRRDQTPITAASQ